jgi:N-acetylglucosamine kinase-like BadF-type ATPase
VVGVDAGGTGSRAVLAEPSGRRLAAASGPGVNPRSSAGAPADALAGLLTRLVQAAPEAAARVSAGVLGLAGAGAAGRAVLVEAAGSAWGAAGLAGTPVVVEDIVVAHAAGSPGPGGPVLVAGTGAVAGLVRDGRILRRADGHGWLLGDTGSAVWLGVQAARAAVAALDGTEEETGLAAQVLADLGVLQPGTQLPRGPEHRVDAAQRAIAVVDSMRPAGLGRLAPLVSRAAAAGDPVAVRLTGAAVDALVRSVGAVLSADADVLVLGGAVLLSTGPVRSGVRAAVHDRWGLTTVDAGDGAGGAAALALRRVGLPVSPEAHARLTTA